MSFDPSKKPRTLGGPGATVVRRPSKVNTKKQQDLNVQPTFTPRINSISKDLDNRLRVLNPTPKSGASSRSDTLYDLALQKLDRLNLKR